MAGSLTNYGEAKVLDALFGGAALGQPGTWYLALFTASPGESGSFSAEAANYARLAVTNNLTNFPAASQADPSTKASGPEQRFAAVSGNTGTITHVGYADAVSGGNLWAYFDLPTSKSYAVGDIPIVPAGALTFTED